jgi:hypothetical protein
MKVNTKSAHIKTTCKNLVKALTCSSLLGLCLTLPTNAITTVKNEKTTISQLSQAANKQRSQPRVLTATILTRGETATTIFKLLNGNTYQATDVDSSGNVTRRRQVSVTFNDNFIQMKSTDTAQDTYRGIISGNRVENGIWFSPTNPVWFGTWTATLE